MQGWIKSLQSQKGYGFIQVEDSKEEYFFHRDDFTGHWTDMVGDYTLGGSKIYVDFEAKKTPKGWRAEKVRRTGWPD